MAKAVATRSIDLEPIDRLEEKVKLLVGLVERLRASDRTRTSDENAPAGARARCGARAADSGRRIGAEIDALREERELIRSRVDEMLAQIEGAESLAMDNTGNTARTVRSWNRPAAS